MLRPLGAPYRRIRAYFDRWLFQLHGARSGPIELVQRRIFILPSRYGIMYIVTLLVMLTGSINYNLSLGFVLMNHGPRASRRMFSGIASGFFNFICETTRINLCLIGPVYDIVIKQSGFHLYP